jgi:hypothetical protein
VTTDLPNDWSQTLRNRTRLSYGQDGPCLITLLDEDVSERRPLGCEPQRARTKRGEDATVPRHSAGIQFVEVRGDRIARVLYVAIDSGWPMPTPSKNRLGRLLVIRW